MRARREELGFSQGDVIKALGYRNRQSVSNIENGTEGVSLRRAYDWADVLEVPRELFYRFVIGDTKSMEQTPAKGDTVAAEAELVTRYRKLPAKQRRLVLERVRELEVLARDEAKRRS